MSHNGKRHEAFLAIREIKDIDNSQTFTRIECGNFATIVPQKVRFESTKVSLKDLQMTYCSFLLGKNTNYKEGNYLLFKTKKSEKNTFQRKYMALRPRQHIKIVWFGKLVELDILCRYLNGDYYYMGAIVADNDIVIMPLDKHCNENNLPYDSFSLEIDNSYFFDAKLESLEYFDLNSQAEYHFYFSVEKKYYKTIKSEFNKQGITLNESKGCFYGRETYYKMCNYFSFISNILNKYGINDYDLKMFQC